MPQIGNLVQKARPSSGSVHQNTILTNHAVVYGQDATVFTYPRAVPTYGATNRSDDFGVIPQSDFLRPQARKRASGAGPHKIEWSTDKIDFKCDIWAIAADIEDDVEANADAWIRLQNTTTEIVMQQLMLQQEIDLINIMSTESNWQTATLGNGTWDDANSTPIIDVRKFRNQIWDDTGMEADSIIMGRDVYDTLVEHGDIKELITGGATNSDPALANLDLLARAFEIPAANIHVTRSRRNTGKEGDSDSIGQIGGKFFNIYARGAGATVGERQPTAVVKVNWTGYQDADEFGVNIMEYESKDTVHARTIEGESAYTYLIESSFLGRCQDAVVA